jgi:hypothetical protein
MKKPIEKRNIRSTDYGVKILFDHPAQYPIASFKDERTDSSEIRIDHLADYIDRIKEARTDGYWSVLREL